MFICQARLIVANEIPIDNAIQIIKGTEKNYNFLSWNVSIQYTFAPPTTKKRTENSVVNAIYDNKSGKYNIESSSHVVEGLESSERADFFWGLTFDGSMYSHWHTNEIANKSAQSGLGIITDDIKKASFHRQHIQAWQLKTFGLVTGMPTIYSRIIFGEDNQLTKFSDIIVEWAKKKSIISVDMDNATSIIVFSVEEPTNIENTVLKTHIVFDIPKGAISQAELKQVQPNTEKVYASWKTEFKMNEKQEYVPKITTYHNFANFETWQFKYVSVNTNTKLSSNDFICKFPDGITVEDTVKKMRFRIGNPFDEDKAISDFMIRHGLTGNVPVKTTSGGIVRYVLIVVGSLIILASIVLHFRKKMQS
jgi:hypothetical protein